MRTFKTIKGNKAVKFGPRTKENLNLDYDYGVVSSDGEVIWECDSKEEALEWLESYEG